MKRSNKISLITIIFTFILTVIILLVFTSRYEHYFYTRPTAQRSTVWISENGEISLRVNEKGNGTLCFKQNGTITEYDYVDDKNYRAQIYHLTDMRTSENHYETWKYTKVENDKFSIVVEETTFFKEGQKITFYKTDKTEEIGDGQSDNYQSRTQGDGSSVFE